MLKFYVYIFIWNVGNIIKVSLKVRSQKWISYSRRSDTGATFNPSTAGHNFSECRSDISDFQSQRVNYKEDKYRTFILF